MRLRFLGNSPRFFAAVFGLGCVGLVACGLEQGGLQSAADDLDGSAGAAADSAPACGYDAQSCAAVTAAGWTPVAYAESALACPAGYGGEQHPIADPSPTPAACVCNVTATVLPDCQTGQVTTRYDVDLFVAYCYSAGLTFSVAGGACNKHDFGYFQHGSQQPIAPAGGSCAAAPTADPSAVLVTTATTCQPRDCAGGLCSGVAPTGFLSCVTHPGQVDCPAGFGARKRTLGSAPSVTCGACPCAVSGQKCTDAHFFLYEDDKCAKLTDDFVSDGSCKGVQSATGAHRSYRYAAKATATFTPGASVPTVDLADALTLCCR
jgi:hypothetical protein